MRLIDISIGLLILLLLGGTLLGVRVFADPDRKLVRNRDAEVIEAALKSLYDAHSARLVGWSSGTFICVNPECGFDTPLSGDFNAEVKKAIKESGVNQMPTTDLSVLKEMASRYAGMSCPVPMAHLDLKSLRMDSRIVVGAPISASVIHNRYGDSGTRRTSGKLKPPFYSPDREAAVLRMTDEPLLTNITFFLKHENGRWRVVYTHFEG